MTGIESKALYIGEQCRKAGMTLAGVAGILANIEAESAFKSTNLQDTYEVSLGMNDAQYTARVDSGSYTRFTSDSAGYGLCQWTAGDRKDGMMKFHRQRGVSIGDFRTQVDWMITEIKGYTRAWRTVTLSNEPYECGYAVCKYYEIPADTEAKAQARGGASQRWYNFLAANVNTPIDIPEEDTAPAADQTGSSAAAKDEDGITIPQTWPPRTVDMDHCTGWREITLLQTLLFLHGYNVLTDGLWTEALTKKVRSYQQANGLTVDGVVGPKTWVSLGLDAAIFKNS